jgi:hypothetical protein
MKLSTNMVNALFVYGKVFIIQKLDESNPKHVPGTKVRMSINQLDKRKKV